MKALIVNAAKQLEQAKMAQPVVKENEVLIKVQAASLNHHDLWTLRDAATINSQPFILGADGAGVVIAVGSKVSSSLVGKEVVINPGLNWGFSEAVQGADFTIIGGEVPGTFAEYITVPPSNCYSKPSFMSFAQAAALPLAAVTAYRALFKKGNIKPGEKVLITGIGGGVALFALQFAVAAKARVYVTSSHGEKIKRAMALGAIDGVNYKDPHWVDDLQQKAGAFGLVIDGAGGQAFSHLINLAAPGARLVNYGRSAGNLKEITTKQLFWKQLSLLGTTMGSPSDLEEMLAFVNTYKIIPVIDECYLFKDCVKAFERMENGQQFGKLVVLMDES